MEISDKTTSIEHWYRMPKCKATNQIKKLRHFLDNFSARLPDEAIISYAEAKEIELAFEHIRMSTYTHFIICSDLLSCL